MRIHRQLGIALASVALLACKGNSGKPKITAEQALKELKQVDGFEFINPELLMNSPHRIESPNGRIQEIDGEISFFTPKFVNNPEFTITFDPLFPVNNRINLSFKIKGECHDLDGQSRGPNFSYFGPNSSRQLYTNGSGQIKGDGIEFGSPLDSQLDTHGVFLEASYLGDIHLMGLSGCMYNIDRLQTIKFEYPGFGSCDLVIKNLLVAQNSH